VQRFVGGAHIARLEQRLGIEPQPSAPRRRYARATVRPHPRGDGAAVQITRCERGIGPLLDGEHLLVRTSASC